MASLELASPDAAPATAELLLEPAFGRWHLRPDCPVLAAQPEAVVLEAPDGVSAEHRACTVCVGVPGREQSDLPPVDPGE